MTEFLHVEPDPGLRPRFALWCLAQDPNWRTSSASGFDVPADLYPSVPAELLEGAYVDGFRVGSGQAPAAAQQAAGAPAEGRDGHPLKVYEKGEVEAVFNQTVDTGSVAAQGTDVVQRVTRAPRKAAARKPRKAAKAPVTLDFGNTDTLLIQDAVGGAE